VLPRLLSHPVLLRAPLLRELPLRRSPRGHQSPRSARLRLSNRSRLSPLPRRQRRLRRLRRAHLPHPQGLPSRPRLVLRRGLSAHGDPVARRSCAHREGICRGGPSGLPSSNDRHASRRTTPVAPHHGDGPAARPRSATRRRERRRRSLPWPDSLDAAAIPYEVICRHLNGISPPPSEGLALSATAAERPRSTGSRRCTCSHWPCTSRLKIVLTPSAPAGNRSPVRCARAVRTPGSTGARRRRRSGRSRPHQRRFRSRPLLQASRA
jgi:hypothetical protein